MKSCFTYLSFGLAFLILASSCDPVNPVIIDDWKTKDDKIISEWLQEKPELSISLAALKKVYVYNTIATYGPYTFLVPNNDAWAKYFNRHEFSGLNDVPLTTLEDIFEYHILPFKRMTDAFSNGVMSEADTTVTGDRLLLDVSNGLDQVKVNNRAEIVESNIEAWNGVIHVLNDVLEPPTLTVGEYLQSNANYSKFVTFLKESHTFDTLTYRRIDVYPYSRNEFTVIAMTNSQMDDLQPFIDSLKNEDLLYDQRVAFDPNYATKVMPNQVIELARSFIIGGIEFTSNSYSGFKKTLGRIPYGDGFMRIKFVLKNNQLIINDKATVDVTTSDIILKNGLINHVDKTFGFLPESPREIVYSASPTQRWNTSQGGSVDLNSTNGYMGDDQNVYGTVILKPQLVGAEFWTQIPNIPAGKYSMTLFVKKQGSKAKIFIDDKLLQFNGVAADGSYDFALLLGNRGLADDLHKKSLSATGLNLFEVSTGSFVVTSEQESVTVKFSTTFINSASPNIAISAIVLEPYAE